MSVDCPTFISLFVVLPWFLLNMFCRIWSLCSLYGPGIVGGFLIPILGAVPDGVIILISGLGDGSKEEIQVLLTCWCASCCFICPLPLILSQD